MQSSVDNTSKGSLDFYMRRMMKPEPESTEKRLYHLTLEEAQDHYPEFTGRTAVRLFVEHDDPPPPAPDRYISLTMFYVEFPKKRDMKRELKTMRRLEARMGGLKTLRLNREASLLKNLTAWGWQAWSPRVMDEMFEWTYLEEKEALEIRQHGWTKREAGELLEKTILAMAHDDVDVERVMEELRASLDAEKKSESSKM